MVKILFFGQLAELAGSKEYTLDGNFDLDDLIKKLEELFPAIKGVKYKVSVNKKLENDRNIEVPDNAEVALLPPFSGG